LTKEPPVSDAAPLPNSDLDPADLAAFTRQLGAMLDAGVDVLRALRISSEYVGALPIVRAADDIARGMRDGREFHQAASRHPELFDPFYVEMTRQGEADGILGKALLAVADYLDRVGGGHPATDPPAIAGAASVRPTAITLAACGAGALGVAAVWSLVGSGKVADKWLGPLSALWAGACLAGGALALQRDEPAAGGAAAAGAPSLPPKSRGRRVAEAEGIVWSALQEQAEADQERAAVRPGPEADAAPPGGLVRGEYDPDPSLHRFEL
jgi:hypothetical protein